MPRSRSRWLGPSVAIALASALILPATAGAANLQKSGAVLIYSAGAGETNTLTVTRTATAFVFADASVATEIDVVGRHVSRMLLAAMREPEQRTSSVAPTEEERAITKVIGDVWLSSLVQWVTGRASATDVSTSLDVAVRLLLR